MEYGAWRRLSTWWLTVRGICLAATGTLGQDVHNFTDGRRIRNIPNKGCSVDMGRDFAWSCSSSDHPNKMCESLNEIFIAIRIRTSDSSQLQIALILWPQSCGPVLWILDKFLVLLIFKNCSWKFHNCWEWTNTFAYIIYNVTMSWNLKVRKLVFIYFTQILYGSNTIVVYHLVIVWPFHLDADN